MADGIYPALEFTFSSQSVQKFLEKIFLPDFQVSQTEYHSATLSHGFPQFPVCSFLYCIKNDPYVCDFFPTHTDHSFVFILFTAYFQQHATNLLWPALSCHFFIVCFFKQFLHTLNSNQHTKDQQQYGKDQL